MSNARLLGQACFTLLLIGFLSTPLVNAQVSVSLPNLEGSVGQTISVPVQLSNVESTSGFSAYRFRVVSNSPGLVFVGHDDTSTLVSDFAGNNSNPSNGLVGGYTSGNQPATQSGILIYIQIRIDSIEPGATLELSEFELSATLPQFTVVSSTPDIPFAQFASGVAVEDELGIPDAFVLSGNYPNPFNPTTNIQFDLRETSDVEISVMDMLGRTMITLPSQTFVAGSNHHVAVDGASLPSGIYIYRVIARSASNSYVGTGTMTLIK